MTAPALILLAGGSDDPEVVQLFHAFRHKLQSQRDELSIHLAFVDHCPPSGPQVVNTLVNRGVQEMVFVPLDMTHAVECCTRTQEMVDRVQALHPQVRIGLSRPLGPCSSVLNILDDRLRSALSKAGATELDALVLSVPDCGDARGNALINRRARQWATHHKLPCVVAVGNDTAPGIATAIVNLRNQGRRHIGVGSFYLGADQAFRVQAEVAGSLGAIAAAPSASTNGCSIW